MVAVKSAVLVSRNVAIIFVGDCSWSPHQRWYRCYYNFIINCLLFLSSLRLFFIDLPDNKRISLEFFYLDVKLIKSNLIVR